MPSNLELYRRGFFRASESLVKLHPQIARLTLEELVVLTRLPMLVEDTVAEEHGMTRKQLHAVLNRLNRKGLAYRPMHALGTPLRKPGDPAPPRNKVWHLAPKGVTALTPAHLKEESAAYIAETWHGLVDENGQHVHERARITARPDSLEN